jgi:hypothetical protein
MRIDRNAVRASEEAVPGGKVAREAVVNGNDRSFTNACDVSNHVVQLKVA